MSADIRAWLEDRELGAYADAFEANDISVDLLAELSDQDLRELGVSSMGHRKRLMRAIRASEEVTAPTGPTGPEAPASPSSSASDTGRAGSEPTIVPETGKSTVEQRQLCVMFCDLVGSTALAAHLDPEAYRNAIREYQDRTAAIIQRYEGFVARYMGDGILAYFGWPRGHEDDGERAIHAALELAPAIAAIEVQGTNAPLQVRAGVATGPVLVGDIIGEGASQEAAITGQTPNLAARLLGLGEPGSIVIDDATKRLLGALFEFEPLGNHALKGIDGEVPAWRVIKATATASRFDAVRGASAAHRLVGRTHELALLLERWRLARQAEGQAVMLMGEAGIGKSRLTKALMEHVGEEDHYRLRFQCSPYHIQSALFPVIGQIERAARFKPDDPEPEKLDKLEVLLKQAGDVSDETVALVANILSLPYEARFGPLELNPQQLKQRTTEALADQVFGLAAQRPVLFLFEDAHWADPSSLELIDLLISRNAAERVMVVITHRPDWHPPFLGQGHIFSLALNRLGRGQIAELIRSISSEAIPDSVIETIIARTDGVPLYVEEMTLSVLEGGVNAGLRDGDVPDSLQGSLTARLDRLSGVAREAAQIASVIGREVPLPLLRHVMGGTDERLDGATADLLSAQLMLRTRLSGDDGLLFRHALIRDAAYQSLLPSRRREIHAKIADVIATHFTTLVETQPELLARHFAEAGKAEPAVTFFCKAGERAVRYLANREAVEHFHSALDQLEKTESDFDRGRIELTIRLQMGLPLIAATGYASDEVRQNYERAVALSEAHSDQEALFTALRGLWNCVYDRGALKDALKLVDRLVDLAERSPNPLKTMLSQRALGSTLKSIGELDRAVDAFATCIDASEPDALKTALRDHGEAPEIISYQYSGWANCVRGDLAKGLDQVQTAVALVEKLEYPLMAVFTKHIHSVVRMFRREYEAALEVSSLVEDASASHGFIFWNAASKVISGSVEAMLGAPHEGLRKAMDGLSSWKSIGANLHVPTWASLLSDAAITCGYLDMADAVTSEGIEVAHAHDEFLALAELKRLRGRLAQERGNSAEALREFEAAIALAKRQGAHLYHLRAASDLARILIASGDPNRVPGLLKTPLSAVAADPGRLDIRTAKTLLTEAREIAGA